MKVDDVKTHSDSFPPKIAGALFNLVTGRQSIPKAELNKRLATVFLSYSRSDSAVAQLVLSELVRFQHEVWIDWSDIEPSVDWWGEIRAAIVSSDIFLVLLSRQSLLSSVCLREMEVATLAGKRIVPLVIETINEEVVPLGIRTLQWIQISPDTETWSLSLRRALDIDVAWLKQHTILLIKSSDWSEARDRSKLLRGAELEQLGKALDRYLDGLPRPVPLQRDFIHQSRRHERSRLLVVLAAAVAAVGISITTAIIALNQRAVARDSQKTAEVNLNTALALQWAAQSNSLSKTDPAAALLLAIGGGQFASTLEGRREALARSAEHALTKLILHGEARPDHVAFSPDGQWLVAGGKEFKVILWNARDGRQVAEVSLLEHWLDLVAVSKGGSYIALYARGGPGGASGAGRIVIWDRARDTVVAEIGQAELSKSGSEDEDDSLGVSAMQFNNAGNELAFATDEGGIYIWSLPDGSLSKRISLPSNSRAVTMAFAKDDTAVFAATYVDDPKISNLYIADRNSRAVRKIMGARGIAHVVVDPIGNLAYAVGADIVDGVNVYPVYSVSAGRAVAHTVGHLSEAQDVTAVGWASSAEDTGQLQCAEPSDKYVRLTHCLIDEPSLQSRMDIEGGEGETIMRSPSAYPVSAVWDGEAFETEPKSPIWSSVVAEENGRAISLAPIGGGTVRVSKDQKLVVQLVEHDKSYDVTVWTVEKGQLQKGRTRTLETEVESIAISADGKLVAFSGSGTFGTLVAALPSLETLKVLEHSGIEWMSFSPDSKSLALSSNPAQRVDWLTGQVLGTFGEESKATAMLGSMGIQRSGRVQFNSNGTLLLIESTLWDVMRQEVLFDSAKLVSLPMAIPARRLGPRKRVVGVEFSERPEILLSSNRGDPILAFPIGGEPLTNVLCRKANRELTKIEWERYASGQSQRQVCATLQR